MIERFQTERTFCYRPELRLLSAFILVIHTTRERYWKPLVCLASGRVRKAPDQDMSEDAWQTEFFVGL